MVARTMQSSTSSNRVHFHPYRKLWTFVQFQKLKLQDTKHQLIRQLSFDQFRSSVKSLVTWKRVAYADAFIHIVSKYLRFYCV